MSVCKHVHLELENDCYTCDACGATVFDITAPNKPIES